MEAWYKVATSRKKAGLSCWSARRSLFLLDEKAYKRFTAALDKPPADNPRLRRVLASKAPPWGDDRRCREIRAPQHLTPESPIDPMTLMITIADMKRAIEGG